MSQAEMELASEPVAVAEFPITGYQGPLRAEVLDILERRAARARARVFRLDAEDEACQLACGSMGEATDVSPQLEFPMSQKYGGIGLGDAERLDSRLAKYEQNVSCNSTVKLPQRAVPTSREEPR